MKTSLLVLTVGAWLTGCAFGTNRVVLPTIPAAAVPAEGALMQVKVRDARADMSGAVVGFKRNGYGAKTGDVQLTNSQPLVDRLRGDIVSVLRERGYRADVGDSGTLDCDVEVLSFSMDTKQGFWSGELQGLAAVRIRITDETNHREVWTDIVRGEYTKSGLQVITAGDHQDVVDKLYSNLIANTRAAVPDGRPSLGTVGLRQGVADRPR